MKLLYTLLCLLLVVTLRADPGDSSRLINTIDLGYPITTVDFSPDGELLAVAGASATVHLYHAHLGIKVKALRDGHKEHINTVRFSPDSRLLATGGSKHKILIWDVASGRLIHELVGHEAPIQDLSFSPNGFYLASASGEDQAIIWNLATGHRVMGLSRHPDKINSVAFGPKGEQLITACSDQKLRIWAFKDGKLLQTLKGHKAAICAVQWSWAADLIASGGKDNSAKIWNPISGDQAPNLPSHPTDVCSLTFNPEGTILGTGGADNLVKLWDLTSGKLIIALTKGAHFAKVEEVDFNPEGTILASCSRDGMVKLWDVPNLEERLNLTVERAMVEWLQAQDLEKAAELLDQPEKRDKERERIRKDLEKQLTTYFEKNVAWQESLTIGKYNEDYGYFRVESPLLGRLRLIVAPKEAEKVKENIDRLEFRYLKMKMEDGQLQVESVMAFLRGMQRRYVTKPMAITDK
ncbi:MAG: WD40 repeat domain-containing protein [Bacteroidota bacterium]